MLAACCALGNGADRMRVCVRAYVTTSSWSTLHPCPAGGQAPLPQLHAFLQVFVRTLRYWYCTQRAAANGTVWCVDTVASSFAESMQNLCEREIMIRIARGGDVSAASASAINVGDVESIYPQIGAHIPRTQHCIANMHVYAMLPNICAYEVSLSPSM